ncbi:MAG TPA: AMP-binding protein [Candidatus Acidoferrales bacterium]|nr:AMP-binding protein [Candidatus Acidoferrales bacterium]
MTFLENIFDRLKRAGAAPVMAEIRAGQIVNCSGADLLARIAQARQFLAAQGLKRGDRCALLAPNSIRWAALDLALMAEGIVVVPLYARQAPHELAGMLKDSSPAQIFCSDAALASAVRQHLPSAPNFTLIESVFVGSHADADRPPYHHADSDPLTIIYTSGTSGEPKGVILNSGNVNHMIPCTNGRLDQLMGTREPSEDQTDRIFHYGPFCFAASWVLLLTALSRNSILMLSTDLTKLSDELKLAKPHYFINVPIFLERVRRKIQDTVQQRGGIAAAVLPRAQRAFIARRDGKASTFVDTLAHALAKRTMFPAIRKSAVGPNLKALICGSAPLSAETQLFFVMLGIPVLQVYGLTETTAICTLDDPRRFEPGRVGPAVPEVEIKTAESGEIIVRGPNIFPGYWQRPAETAAALEGGWFHTGDLGDCDANGNWRITGRVKDLIILSSGHNVAPEAIENELANRLPEAQQVVVVGNQRSSLAVLLTTAASNGLKPAAVQSAIEAINDNLPHYKQVRAFRILSMPFTVEDGLLTTMGKLKRDAIAARCAAEIEAMYRKKPS